MPRVADYKIIKDDKFTLTSTPPGNFHEEEFKLDSPHVGGPSILALRLDYVDADHFEFNVKVNGTPVLLAKYSGGGFFTIHTVIDANVLKAKEPNSIQFIVTNLPSGSVRISDIVLWYQHEV